MRYLASDLLSQISTGNVPNIFFLFRPVMIAFVCSSEKRVMRRRSKGEGKDWEKALSEN